jgi:hypothetical protein
MRPAKARENFDPRHVTGLRSMHPQRAHDAPIWDSFTNLASTRSRLSGAAVDVGGRRIRRIVRRVPMTALAANCRRILVQVVAPIAIAAVALANGPAHATDMLTVLLDQAIITKLPAHVSTIVIGNPLIADVTVQPGGLVVVTGKAYGMTNLIALDRAGAVLTERNIEVRAPLDRILIVYRGVNRESYECTPDCQPTAVLGDGTAFFNETLGQAANRSARAQSQAGNGAGQR